MSDTENDKPKLGMRQPLGLKRTVETGKVKQSFSHGRSNTVVVEVKRRRVLGPQGGPAPEEQTPAPAPEAPAPQAAPRPAAPAPRPPVSNETAQERQARLLREADSQRMQSLEDARRREERARTEAAEEERRRGEERARAEAEAAEAAKAAAAAPAPAPKVEEPAPAPAPAPVEAPAPAPVETPAPAPATGTALSVSTPPLCMDLIHRRLGHASEARCREFVQQSADLTTQEKRQALSTPLSPHCGVCLAGKLTARGIHRQEHTVSAMHAQHPGDLVSLDLIGPM